jgi:transporter family protein
MHFPLWLVFALIALLTWGLSGIVQKLSTNEISTELALLWFCYAMFALSVVVLVFVRLSWHLSVGLFCIAAFAGILNALGVMASFAALESGGKASIVIPLTCLYPLVTICIAVMFLHEGLTRMQITGVVLAVVAAILLSQEAPTDHAKDAL